MSQLVVLYGPTAVGKTQTSIALAKALHCHIVSADSRQFFRAMRIGTAYPSEDELAKVPHHLVGHRDIQHRYSCGQYELDALQILDTLFQHDDVAILTGGSMLYLDAVTKGMDSFPPPDMEIRQQLSARMQEKGVDDLLLQLRQLDAITYARIDRRNGARVLRALEVTIQTGVPYSQWIGRRKSPRPFDTIKVGLRRDWEDLTARINARVDQMLAQGLEDEARFLYPHRGIPALRTVGYTEFFAYFAGRMTKEQAVEKIKINTRRYAKRQMRWWQRDPDIQWFHPEEFPQLLAYVHSQRSIHPRA